MWVIAQIDWMTLWIRYPIKLVTEQTMEKERE
jgi:hypothetical protein